MMKWLLLICIGLAYSLTLYVVPHSHCDTGWLETFEDYYKQKVSNILTNVLKIMKVSPDYKFVWSETSFLERWMRDQGRAQQDEMRSLIKSGRIEIVGGGISQHDESLSDFESVVRNLETGHKYLFDTFGIDHVEVAWQIDPFGHSALSPSIFSKFGYKYMVGNRIDRNFKNQLTTQQSMEFAWEGSKLGGSSYMLTHILKDGYNPPDCEGLTGGSCCFNNRDPGKACADYFYKHAHKLAENYPTGNVMMVFGEDFSYDNYNKMLGIFDAIQKSAQLVRSDNAYTDFEIKIATASEYFRAIESSGFPFSVYRGDFLPYQYPNKANSPAYWTGYYTTRPDLKKKISEVHKLARATEIAVSLGLKETVNSPEASLTIHHDAITGTCRGHVKQNYMERLYKEEQSNFDKLERVYNELLDKEETKLSLPYRVFILFNSLNWEKEEIITIKSETQYMVILDWNLENVKSQSVPTEKAYEIYFKIKVPSLAIVTIFVRNSYEPCLECSEDSQISDELEVKDSYHTIHFKTDFLIDKIKTRLGEKWVMNQQFWNYPGTRGGFYIYAPKDEGKPMVHLVPSSYKVYIGSVVTVVKSSWTKQRDVYDHGNTYNQTVILSNSKKFTIKIEVFAYKSEEILMRFTEPDLENLEWLYTSNSADLRLRKYQKQEVKNQGHNMYPVPGGFCIRGQESVLNVFPSFNLGVGIKSKSSFEMLLHRNLLNDDGFGLAGAYSDSSFIEHRFDMEISDFNPKEFFRSYFDYKNPLIVKLANVENQRISFVKDRNHDEYDKWPLKTLYSFGIQDEKAYLSSAVVKNQDLFMRIFNFDSDLKWENVTFGDFSFFNGYKNTDDNYSFTVKPPRSTNFLEPNTDKHLNYILDESRPYSGYTPEDWEGFEFTNFIVNYNAPAMTHEIVGKIEEAILEKEEAILEKEEAILEKEEAILEKEEAIPEKEEAIPEKEEAIPEKEEAIPEKTDNQDEILDPESSRSAKEEDTSEEIVSDTQFQDDYQHSTEEWAKGKDDLSSIADWNERDEEKKLEINSTKEGNDQDQGLNSLKSQNQEEEELDENSTLLEALLDTETAEESTDTPLKEDENQESEPTKELQEERKFLETQLYSTTSKQSQIEQNIQILEYSVILVLSLIFLGIIFHYFRAKKRSID